MAEMQKLKNRSTFFERGLADKIEMCYSKKRITKGGVALRQRSSRCVVSFYTTAGAMAAERLCRREGLEGRLISVPRSVTSDCGLAWSAPPELRETLERCFQEAGIEAAGFHMLSL